MNGILKNKWTWITGVALLAGAIFWFGFSQTDTAVTEAADGETTIAFIGDLSENATASGEVMAAQEASLSLLSTGEVTAVNVQEGDSVQAGDLLVELESESLVRAVESAESAVRVAEAELANLLADQTSSELASAEAKLASAQAKLDDLLAGPTEAEIAASQASVDAAQANVWSASGSLSAKYETSNADVQQALIDLETAQENMQAAEEAWVQAAVCNEDSNGNIHCETYDTTEGNQADRNVELARAELALAEARLADAQTPDNNSVASSQASVASAQASYDAAVARHESLLAGAMAEEIASAEADLVSAQASLDTLLAGPLATDIQTYETRLAQAQTDLTAARNNLADATLVAPFDGVVTEIFVAEGETASGQAVNLIDMSGLEVVLSVDEVDIGQISMGQPAVVSVETWPDVEIVSEVIAIAPSAVNQNDLISFDVTLSLAESDLPILVGMTANADLITANRENVLLVATSALTADRDTGQYFVNVVNADGTTEQVEVSIGLRDSQFTQITSGLEEGIELLMGGIEAPVAEAGFGPGR
ncbi:MAG: efflux RND transporter periplasmic adaptor subunit [Anaerolineae bacterium]